MSVESVLTQRCGAACGLRRSNEGLEVFPVPPNNDGSADQSVLLCVR